MVFLKIPKPAHFIFMMTIRKSNERGHANHGWLDSYHTFSFADYHDPGWMGYHGLRVINDDLIMPGMGFGTHGHKDMEIITYILSGAIEHKDSMGHGRVIRAGDVQYMAAGSGVRHSEFNPSSTEPTHLLQIWIQPKLLGVQPRYAEKSLHAAQTGQWHLITSEEGRSGSLSIHQNADLWMARLEPGQKLPLNLAARRHAWLHVAEGAVELEQTALEGGDAAAWSDPGEKHLTAQKASQILFFDLQ